MESRTALNIMYFSGQWYYETNYVLLEPLGYQNNYKAVYFTLKWVLVAEHSGKILLYRWSKSACPGTSV